MKPLNRKNYGSIPHLLGSKLGATDKYVNEGQHRILTEKTRDKHDYVIVTEKYDGSNVGIAKVGGRIVCITRSGYLAETSPYIQHHYFAEWVGKQKDRFSFIGEGERLTGEWLMQVHGMKYLIQEDPFIAFDYFTHDNKRVSHSDLIVKTVLPNIQTPRIIFHGRQAFRLDLALEALNNNKHLHTVMAECNPEGLVYRVERKGYFDFAAKFVRADFEPGKYCIDVKESDLIWNVTRDYL